MTPITVTESKPLAKNNSDPMWTQIFRLVGKDEKNMAKLIDWLSDEGLDHLYWLAPNNTWRRALSRESEHRKKLRKLDRKE